MLKEEKYGVPHSGIAHALEIRSMLSNHGLFFYRDVAQKEPMNAEYVAVPNQESVPAAAVPPSKESTETNEYVTPEEIEVATAPENEMQEAEHQSVA